MYEIGWSNTCLKKLKNLEKQTARSIINKIEEIKENPLPFFRLIKAVNSHELKFRDYRLFADLDQSKKKLTILTFGHLSEVYS